MAVERFIHSRRPDWDARWAEFIHDCLQLSSDLAIDWEYVNCFQFTGMGVEVITGHDPYEPFGEAVSSPISAAKEIKKWGYNCLDDVFPDMFREIPLAFAQPGDVLLVRPQLWTCAQGEEEASRIMPHAVALADPPFYYAPSERGLGRGNMYSEAIRAFAVGHDLGVNI